MRIGQLASQCQCPPETIRYYEKVGLLPPPQRTTNGYRYYDESHRNWLQFILRTRNLGFTQSEVRQLTEIAGQDHSDCAAVHQMLTRHSKEICRKISELKHLERALNRLKAHCEEGTLQDCPVIDELMDQQ